ncbi:hypothetical protein [Adhaeribacter aerolatus]|nr:hypothetical protein [Adhaeribacter aerolatus]
MVKELAVKTYKYIFEEGLHFIGNNDEEIFLMIKSRMALLNSDLERVIFIEELKELFEKDKLRKAKEQYNKYGEVLMNDYSRIKALYLSLDSIGIKKKKDNSYTLNWLGTDKYLEKLHSLLINYYIDGSATVDTLKNVFSKNITTSTSPIIWLKSNRLLVVFFEELLRQNLITNFKYPSIIEKFLLFSTSKGKVIKGGDLTTPKNLMSIEGMPKGTEELKRLINSIKH